MSKPSLYEITRQEVEPLADLMKAVVEANWHLYLAREQGWCVTLSVNEDGGEIAVAVERSDGWPCAAPVEPTEEQSAA